MKNAIRTLAIVAGLAFASNAFAADVYQSASRPSDDGSFTCTVLASQNVTLNATGTSADLGTFEIGVGATTLTTPATLAFDITTEKATPFYLKIEEDKSSTVSTTAWTGISYTVAWTFNSTATTFTYGTAKSLTGSSAGNSNTLVGTISSVDVGTTAVAGSKTAQYTVTVSYNSTF